MTSFLIIADKELPVSFSMRALNQFCLKHKLTIGGLIKMLGDEDEPGNIKLTFEQLHNLLAVALKEGHRKERKKFTLSDEDIFDLFDEKPGLFTEVLELFAASLTRTFQGDEEKNSQALKAAKAKSAK